MDGRQAGARRTRWCGAVVLVAAAAACNPQPPDERGYIERVAAARAEKDIFLRDDPESPVPANRKSELLPLEYYAVDPLYNVPAKLQPSDDNRTFPMSTSAGTQDLFRKVGTLEFTLHGQPLSLTAFAPASARTVDRLFVPFRDATNKKHTYDGGRYLDIDRTATGIYELDFNRAYTPNCYFSPIWICPLPPAENHLPVAIEAGEQIKASSSSPVASR